MELMGIGGPNIAKFCLFTLPLKWKCASSLITKLFTNVGYSVISFLMQWQNSKRTVLSWSERNWTTKILYGWNFKLASKICLTLRSDMCKAIACFPANRRGLHCTDVRTRTMFGSVHAEWGRLGGYLLVTLSAWFHCWTERWIASLDSATFRLSSRQNALSFAMMELVLRYHTVILKWDLCTSHCL